MTAAAFVFAVENYCTLRDSFLFVYSPKTSKFFSKFPCLDLFFSIFDFILKIFKSFKRNNLSRLSVVHCLQYSEIDIIRLKYF